MTVSENNRTQGSPEKAGSSALDREAKRVDDLMKPKQPDQEKSEAELSDKERPLRVEQDARVAATAQEAKQNGAGAEDAPDDLNKDG